jgi:uncharacterized cupin superfamily protein
MESLVPGDLVCFPEGPDGAHRFLNDTDAPARVVIFSTKNYPAIAVYPDSGKVGAITGAGAKWIFREADGSVPYYDGES